MSEQASQAPPAEPAVPTRGRRHRRRLIGRVRSDKMDKTVVVETVRLKLHPVYKKYVRVRKRYKAHDEQNECRIGDRVEIM
jgi:small subunit ribosomal protein S17